jgi:hypothetical protein
MPRFFFHLAAPDFHVKDSTGGGAAPEIADRVRARYAAKGDAWLAKADTVLDVFEGRK